MFRQKDKFQAGVLQSVVLVLLLLVLSRGLGLRWPFLPRCEAGATLKKVLFISSYSESFETVDLQKKGIRQVFDPQNIQLDIEYMDMKRFNNAANEELFYKTLAYKLAHHAKYDAVLLGDDAALLFAQKHQAELFAGLPLVFFCVNERTTAVKAGENPFITGSIEEFYLEDTIDLALKLQPEAKNIIAIYDNTLTGQGDQKQFYGLQNKYSNYNLLGINTSLLTWQEFAAKLEALDRNSIVIYLDTFEDLQGSPHTIDESVKYITAHAPVPVYRTSIGGVGQGLLGGKMVSYEDSGRVAAETVVKILAGTDVASIPVSTIGESDYYFDYEVMKSFGLNPRLLPEDAIIINRELSWWEQHHEMLLPLAVVCLISLILILAMLRETLHQRRFNRRLEEKERRLRFNAEHDYLTGLYNRRAIVEKLKDFCKEKRDLTLLLLNIDDFKDINDTDGHACGDAVLKVIARRLYELHHTDGCLVSRFGSDEFLLVVFTAEAKPLEDFLLKLRTILAMPVTISEKRHFIKVSLGIMCSRAQDRGPSGVEALVDEMLGNAGLAVHEVKTTGKNGYAYYNLGMKAAQVRVQYIREILLKACQEDGFEVVYQPQVETATGLTKGYEALLRVKGQKLSPAEFIPVAEQTGMIITIGRIVTKKVVEQLAVWRAHKLSLHPVAINFSSKQLLDKAYVLYLKNLLDEQDLPAALVEIEITESIFINNSDQAMRLFKEFSSIGIALTLDDFGTGYSSINYLTYIPVQKIKLDKSLIDIYLREGKDSFINNLIRLAHGLGLKLTVEGVECLEQLERLKNFGCDFIQGFYFSKPISGQAVEEKKFF